MKQTIFHRTLPLLLILALLAVCAGCGKKQNDTPTDVEPAGIHHAVITVKDYGEISLELDGDTAPITVRNFMELANSGFYDGLTFHRILENFMIQGGDPKADGTGGSENTIAGEFTANGRPNDISHVRGVISMARNDLSMDSASSQFFIVQADSPHLDGQYAAFGHVTDGMDVVDAIVADTTDADPKSGLVPREHQPVIESIVITD